MADTIETLQNSKEKTEPQQAEPISLLSAVFEQNIPQLNQSRTSRDSVSSLDPLGDVQKSGAGNDVKKLALALEYYGEAISAIDGKYAGVVTKDRMKKLDQSTKSLDGLNGTLQGLQNVKDQFGTLDKDKNGFLIGIEMPSLTLAKQVSKLQRNSDDELFIESSGVSRNDLDLEIFEDQRHIGMVQGVQDIMHGKQPESKLASFVLKNWDKIDANQDGIVTKDELNSKSLASNLGSTELAANVLSFLRSHAQEISKMSVPLYSVHGRQEPYSFSFQDLTSLKNDQKATSEHREMAKTLLDNFVLLDRDGNGAIMGAELLPYGRSAAAKHLTAELWDNETNRHSLMHRYNDLAEHKGTKQGFSARDIVAIDTEANGRSISYRVEPHADTKSHLRVQRALETMRPDLKKLKLLRD